MWTSSQAFLGGSGCSSIRYWWFLLLYWVGVYRMRTLCSNSVCSEALYASGSVGCWSFSWEGQCKHSNTELQCSFPPGSPQTPGDAEITPLQQISTDLTCVHSLGACLGADFPVESSRPYQTPHPIHTGGHPAAEPHSDLVEQTKKIDFLPRLSVSVFCGGANTGT